MLKSILIVGASSVLLAAPSFAAELQIEVQGISEARGSLMVSVFDKTENWLRRPIKAEKVAASKGAVKLSFADLPEGEYSVSVIHDENGNGKFDSNPMGIPIEPWGFSNDATGIFGPAKFDDAKFRLPAGGTAIVINLKS